MKTLTAPEYPVKKYKDDEGRWEVERDMRIGKDFRQSFCSFDYDTASEILKESGGNDLYSPASLYFSLALAASGAKCETEEQL